MLILRIINPPLLNLKANIINEYQSSILFIYKLIFATHCETITSPQISLLLKCSVKSEPRSADCLLPSTAIQSRQNADRYVFYLRNLAWSDAVTSQPKLQFQPQDLQILNSQSIRFFHKCIKTDGIHFQIPSPLQPCEILAEYIAYRCSLVSQQNPCSPKMTVDP